MKLLKRLYEEYNFKIETVLIKEYKRLGLNSRELNILLIMLVTLKNETTFSVTAIAEQMDYPKNEIEDLIESLLDKKFIEFKLETIDDKQREVCKMDQTFDQITSLFNKDYTDSKKQEQQNDISDVVTKLEQSVGRMLKNNELERVRSWFEDDRYSYNSILEAIDLAANRASVVYVEKILSQQIPKKVEIDPETDKALEELFKKI